ncbi:MAG: TetR/AcrR family transcriptional regulator [Candidatus Omnitrophica bacterium]|nr:TetR/AcrR family transcriptional regulator [Candidatus Omnitrophota bacterium]
MVRTAQAHPVTKEKLLDAAQTLMLGRGFPATTVDAICDEAGVTKGSFFHYFESKEALGKALLERFAACAQQMIEEAPFQRQPDPLQRVYGYLDFTIALSKDPKHSQGCLLGTFAQELSDTSPEIRRCCANSFARWVANIQRDLDAARRRYAPKAPIDTKSLAEHLIAVMEGSIILCKAQRDPRVVERNLGHFRRYLTGLFGR